VLGNGGWWGDAEMFETILDAFETTGDARYREIFSELYNNFLQRNGTDWTNNEFNDDITWMVLACVRAYKFFGVQDYLDKARKNYDAMYNRAHQRFGTLVWKQSQENKLATNSCINCPATVAACYLAEATGDEAYYGKALSIYKAQRQLLFDASNGQVYDSRAWTSDGSMEADFNHWASTYNQGTMLGAAVLLYEYTGNTQYLSDADKIYNYTISNLCDGDSIIKVCQTISGDLCGFKGIFMRYARRYAHDLNHEDALAWMKKNAWRAWQNRNSKGVTWSAWLTKTSEDFKRKEGNDEKDITNDAFGASTAVSVAFNAHVNHMFSKNAFSTNPAACFDDLKFMQLSEEDGDTCAVLNLRDGYAGFRRVDFGDSGAQNVVLRVNATQSRTKLIVYADSVVADRRLGDTGFITMGQWQDKTIKLSERLTGKHTLYFVTTNAGAKLHDFRFFADADGISALVPDRPENAGIYTINGMKVSNNSDIKALPRGLYVVGRSHGKVVKVIR
jgi:predicted alpha-1,6-mannanase (GH76 family)